MATAYQDVQSEADLTEDQIQDQLASFVGDLQTKVDEQVRAKQADTEPRWLDNLRAFHGRYDDKTEQELSDAKKSRAFVKITRKKTNSWDARLGALLFPTDDENWDIRPTPVPTLHEASKAAIAAAEAAIEQANQAQQQAAMAQEQAAQQPDPAAAQQMAMAGQQMQGQAGAMAGAAQSKLNEAQMLHKAMEEAKKRGEAMRQEMRDQLVECDYPAECRRVIRDACRIGTGILKGPLSGDQARGQWVQIEGQYVYKREEDPAPVFKWVDPWSYFPDMSAIRPEDREFEFERHLWSAKDLRRLVKERGFSPRAVRELLDDRPKGQSVNATSMNYLVQLRAIGGTTEAIKDRFVGWEYHGALDCKDIALVLRALGNEEVAAQYEAENDPLKEIRVIVWFCEGKLLKMSPAYPLDSGESLYSIFNFEDSEASLFGYGVPHIMADTQASMNGAWRMALDNAALSAGPQIFLDKDAIEPASRTWDLTPRKIWYKRKGASLGGGPVLEVANIPNNVMEIMNIVETSRRFIDDETALPVQAEGELTDNPNITATATNFMSMASNITFRRVVKNFDDGITAPSMRRLYDWNMQHNSRDDIKGDMKVDARGSTALLQRELQAQALLNIAQNWTSHPVLKHAIKTYDSITDALRSAMIQPGTLMKSAEEFEESLAKEAEAAAQASQNDPVIVAANVRKEATQIDADSRIQVAQMQHQSEMMKTAQHYDVQLEKLVAMLGIKEMDVASKERIFAAEVEAEDRRQTKARARGEEAKGSGGYV